MKLKLLSIFLLFSSLSFANGSTQLLLIGGGNHPAKALSHFIDAAGGTNAKILVITWATDFPDDSIKGMIEELQGVSPGVSVLEAARRPLTLATRNLFLAQVQASTAIYFSGGDQNKIMSEIDNAEVRRAITDFYMSGKVVAGTSAGTAIMSPNMFTGAQDQTESGLGLLPRTLVDTHFLVRGRITRLQSALQRKPWLTGLGIDQDNAIWITNDRHVQVIGPTHLTKITTKITGKQVVETYIDGESFELW